MRARMRPSQPVAISGSAIQPHQPKSQLADTLGEVLETEKHRIRVVFHHFLLTLCVANQESYTSSRAVLLHVASFPSIAATRSLEPDPHRETTLTACMKGMFSGCTRSGL